MSPERTSQDRPHPKALNRAQRQQEGLQGCDSGIPEESGKDPPPPALLSPGLGDTGEDMGHSEDRRRIYLDILLSGGPWLWGSLSRLPPAPPPHPSPIPPPPPHTHTRSESACPSLHTCQPSACHPAALQVGSALFHLHRPPGGACPAPSPPSQASDLFGVQTFVKSPPCPNLQSPRHTHSSEAGLSNVPVSPDPSLK